MYDSGCRHLRGIRASSPRQVTTISETRQCTRVLEESSNFLEASVVVAIRRADDGDRTRCRPSPCLVYTNSGRDCDQEATTWRRRRCNGSDESVSLFAKKARRKARNWTVREFVPRLRIVKYVREWQGQPRIVDFFLYTCDSDFLSRTAHPRARNSAN